MRKGGAARAPRARAPACRAAPRLPQRPSPPPPPSGSAAGNKSGVVIPAVGRFSSRTAADVERELKAIGFDAETAGAAAASSAAARGRKRERDDGGARRGASAAGDDMDDGEAEAEEDAPKRAKAARSASARARKTVLDAKYGGDAKARTRGVLGASRAPFVKPPQAEGLKDEAARATMKRKVNKFRAVEFHGTQGESDRKTVSLLPKWLCAWEGRGRGARARHAARLSPPPPFPADSGKMGFSRDRR